MIPREHHWQPALGRDGEVAGLDDLRQAIAIILRTPRGSDPLRPEFGSNLHLYIDYPVNRARPHLVRETVDALRRWEPRLSVVSVAVSQAGDSGVKVSVVFRLASGIEATAEVMP
jgi:phage baseplate assembly protein W